MSKKLKDIRITHISLVKAGANGKEFIYKSREEEPSYSKILEIKKNDEKGIVCGIVYEPDTIDSQNEFATKEEIEKAAYDFMKGLNNLNVDKGHSFKNENAYVCESWLVKKGDPLFPDSKEGAWAVAIKLESEELKDAVKKGEYKSLSMAGSAIKEEVKEDEKSLSDTIKSIFENVLKSLKNESVQYDKEKLETLIKEQIEPLIREKEKLSSELEKTKLDLAKTDIQLKELKAEITKSQQTTDPIKSVASDAKELAKQAGELIIKEAAKGNVLSVAEAVSQLCGKKE